MGLPINRRNTDDGEMTHGRILLQHSNFKTGINQAVALLHVIKQATEHTHLAKRLRKQSGLARVYDV